MDDIFIYYVFVLFGGGYCGLYIVMVLVEFEEKLGYFIVQYFDLICGIFVGGMLVFGFVVEILVCEL